MMALVQKSALMGVVVAVVGGGCAYTPQEVMNPARQGELRGKTFSVATHEHVDKRIQTLAKTGLFGELAASHYTSEAERVSREDGIADPAVAATEQIAGGLIQRYGMVQTGEKNRVYTGVGHDTFVKVDVPDLLAFYTEGDYLLDVDSNMWWMIYNLGDGYKVVYNGYVRLIDRKSGEAVAAKTCVFNSNDVEDDHPSYDEMLANHSAKLKEYLGKASEKCARDFLGAVAGGEK